MQQFCFPGPVLPCLGAPGICPSPAAETSPCPPCPRGAALAVLPPETSGLCLLGRRVEAGVLPGHGGGRSLVHMCPSERRLPSFPQCLPGPGEGPEGGACSPPCTAGRAPALMPACARPLQARHQSSAAFFTPTGAPFSSCTLPRASQRSCPFFGGGHDFELGNFPKSLLTSGVQEK